MIWHQSCYEAVNISIKQPCLGSWTCWQLGEHSPCNRRQMPLQVWMSTERFRDAQPASSQQTISFCIISCWHLTSLKEKVLSTGCPADILNALLSDWAAPPLLDHSQAGNEGSVEDCPTQSKHRGFWRDADLKTVSAQPLECAKPLVSAFNFPTSIIQGDFVPSISVHGFMTWLAERIRGPFCRPRQASPIFIFLRGLRWYFFDCWI